MAAGGRAYSHGIAVWSDGPSARMTHCMKGSAVTRCAPWPVGSAGAMSGTPTTIAARAATNVMPAFRHSAPSETSSSAARAAGAPSASPSAGASAS